MKITIESTSKIVEVEFLGDRGERHLIEARIWQGETDSGIPVQCFVTRIAPEIDRSHPRIDELTAEFERELLETVDPRPSVRAIPLRLMI